MVDLSKVAVVIRSYNNPKLEDRLDVIKDWGVARILVVSKSDPDDNGVTPPIVSKSQFRPLVQHVFLTKNYQWTPSLNAAMAYIAMENAGRTEKIRYVLNVSVEALLEKNHLESMCKRADTSEVIAVGTTFRGYEKTSYSSPFRSDNGDGDGTWIPYILPGTYERPRNTAMLIDLKQADGPLGFFNPMCDDWGGMEDTEFLLRAQLNEKSFVNLDLKVPLLIGDYDKQKRKEKDEERAVETIKAFVRSLAPENADEAFFTQFEGDCEPRDPNC